MDADPRLAPSPDDGTTASDTLDAGAAPSFSRLRALIEVIACCGYPTQLLIGLLILPFGLGPDGHGGLTLRGLTALLAIDSVVLLALVGWFLKASGESPASVLLGWRPPVGEAVLGVSITPVVFALVLAVGITIDRLAPWMRAPANPFGALIGSPRDAIVLALVGLLAGGFREEIQRAFILHRFEQHLGGARVGLVCFSVLFGLGHYVQGWAAVLTTAGLGAFWGIVYLSRRSVVAAMVSHGIFNLVQVAIFRLHP